MENAYRTSDLQQGSESLNSRRIIPRESRNENIWNCCWLREIIIKLPVKNILWRNDEEMTEREIAIKCRFAACRVLWRLKKRSSSSSCAVSPRIALLPRPRLFLLSSWLIYIADTPRNAIKIYERRLILFHVSPFVFFFRHFFYVYNC